MRMRAKRVSCHELLRHLPRDHLIYAALHVDISKFVKLERGVRTQLSLLSSKVGSLSVRLRVDRQVLSS